MSTQTWIAESRKILRLAIPLIITNIAFIMMGVIDTMMSGLASAEDLAGLAIGGNIWLFLELAMGGLITAITPRIARFFGANKFEDIKIETQQSLLIGILFGIFALFVLLIMIPYFPLLGASSEVTIIAQGYTTVIAYSLPASAVIWVLFCLLEGHGIMRFTVTSSLIAVIVNLILDYIFVFGKLGLPAMGGVGCAWTTTTIYCVWAVVCIIYTAKHKEMKKYGIYDSWPAFNWKRWRDILALGTPIAIALVAEEGFFNITALLIAPLGTESLGAHHITIQIVALILMLGVGVGQATAIRVAQDIGRSQITKMDSHIKTSMSLVLFIGLFFGLCVFLFRDAIPMLFTNDAKIAVISSTIMLFAPLYLLSDVMQIWAAQTLRGFEDTKVPMMLQIFSFWAIGFPLGYSLGITTFWGERYGIYGFWIGILTGIIMCCCLICTRLYLKAHRYH